MRMKVGQGGVLACSASAQRKPVILRTKRRKDVIISAGKNIGEVRQFCVQRSRHSHGATAKAVCPILSLVPAIELISEVVPGGP